MILLEELNTEFGHIKIVRTKKSNRLVYYQNEYTLSEADSEGTSTCGYVHVMYSLIGQSRARRVLVIGCAGGTLATMLQRAGCEVTVVDINPHAFVLARKYFNMPQDVRCMVECGVGFLEKNTEYFDAIAVDAFDNEGNVANPFITQEFFALARTALTPSGVMVMNVIMQHDLDTIADRVGHTMEEAGLSSILFDWDQEDSYRNIIIAGGESVEQMQVSAEGTPLAVRKELKNVTSRKARKLRSKALA